MTATIGVVCVATEDHSGNKHHWRFGSRCLLELVVRRLTDCQRLDKVLVVGGPDFQEGRLAGTIPPDVAIHLSDRRHTLGQLVSALEATGAAALVKIDADHPFIDPILIDRLVTTAQSQPCDYAGFCFRDGRPVVRSPLGTFAHWFGANALRRVERMTRHPHTCDDPAKLFCSQPESFKLRFVPLPAELESERHCLAVDDHQAWEHAQTIYDWLGPEGLDWRAIANALSG